MPWCYGREAWSGMNEGLLLVLGMPWGLTSLVDTYSVLYDGTPGNTPEMRWIVRIVRD